MGKKGRFTSQISLLDLFGSASGNDETGPFNVTQNQASTDGSIDQTSDRFFKLNLNFGLTFRL